MNLRAIADAWSVIARDKGLPTLSVGRLKVSTRRLDQQQRAWEALKALPLREGWLQFQSSVVCFADGKTPEHRPEWGGLLAAEVAALDGRSILVRQDGSGGLLLVIATPAPDDDAEELMVDTVSQLATGRVGQLPGVPQPARLHYRRYWRYDQASGYRPVFTAFIGFARPE
jgi:hypothetical protein